MSSGKWRPFCLGLNVLIWTMMAKINGAICRRHKATLSDITTTIHDDVIKRKYFPRYWPFVLVNYRSPVTQSVDVFFDLRPNKRLSKQWWDNDGQDKLRNGPITSYVKLRDARAVMHVGIANQRWRGTKFRGMCNTQFHVSASTLQTEYICHRQ